MSSGIDADPECLIAHQSMKIKAPKSKGDVIHYRAILYKIENDRIVIDRKIPKEENQEQEYRDICASLPPKEGRYIVWDLELKTKKDAAANDKLVFMAWMPDIGPVKARMVFASSKENFKKQLQMNTSIDCNDMDDMDYCNVLEKVASK